MSIPLCVHFIHILQRTHKKSAITAMNDVKSSLNNTAARTILLCCYVSVIVSSQSLVMQIQENLVSIHD
jgi:hypothetical protein